jgi:hypothetical protein
MNLYDYVLSNPSTLIDPWGMMPNKKDTISLDIYIVLIEMFEARAYFEECQILDPCKVLAKASDATRAGVIPGSRAPEGVPKLPWGYIYTEKAGPIDLGHFLFAAKAIDWMKPPKSRFGVLDEYAVRAGGVFQEWWQTLHWVSPRGGVGSYSSANTPEDRPSNREGARFGRSLICGPNAPPLSQQLRT